MSSPLNIKENGCGLAGPKLALKCSVTMKCPKLVVSLFLWICILDLGNAQEPFAGPYQIVLRQFEQCENSGTRKVYANSTRLTKVSRTKYLYSTNATTEVYLNDDITLELDIAIFGNGGWRPHYMQGEFPHLCTTTKQMAPVLYKALVDLMHLDCPIPPGTYEIKNFDIQSISIFNSIPNFPYGKYRADVFMTLNGTLLGCLRYYADVIPNRKVHQERKPRKKP
ncbi:uncharacterized protein [Halyomorpha halys]|uniref:uncharacterized protein isoform X2 n=1 Tax=Halyomorpha halys TaxID=286706 RepID=UPI0006D5001B